MAARLHDDACRAKLSGWGIDWATACDCTSGRLEEQQRVLAAGRPGTIVSVFRGRRLGVGIRFVVEDTVGRHAVCTAKQIVAVPTAAAG